MPLHTPAAFLAVIAESSHDPDTQTACYITYGDQVLVTCANRMPPGIAVTPERTQRPAKYSFINHAERGAIDEAARKGICLLGTTLYLNWFPCCDCARSMIAAGIKTLVAHRPSYELRKDDPRYGFASAMEMLAEARVGVEWWD